MKGSLNFTDLNFTVNSRTKVCLFISYAPMVILRNEELKLIRDRIVGYEKRKQFFVESDDFNDVIETLKNGNEEEKQQASRLVSLVAKYLTIPQSNDIFSIAICLLKNDLMLNDFFADLFNSLETLSIESLKLSEDEILSLSMMFDTTNSFLHFYEELMKKKRGCEKLLSVGVFEKLNPFIVPNISAKIFDLLLNVNIILGDKEKSKELFKQFCNSNFREYIQKCIELISLDFLSVTTFLLFLLSLCEIFDDLLNSNLCMRILQYFSIEDVYKNEEFLEHLDLMIYYFFIKPYDLGYLNDFHLRTIGLQLKNWLLRDQKYDIIKPLTSWLKYCNQNKKKTKSIVNCLLKEKYDDLFGVLTTLIGEINVADDYEKEETCILIELLLEISRMPNISSYSSYFVLPIPLLKIFDQDIEIIKLNPFFQNVLRLIGNFLIYGEDLKVSLANNSNERLNFLCKLALNGVLVNNIENNQRMIDIDDNMMYVSNDSIKSAALGCLTNFLYCFEHPIVEKFLETYDFQRFLKHFMNLIKDSNTFGVFHKMSSSDTLLLLSQIDFLSALSTLDNSMIKSLIFETLNNENVMENFQNILLIENNEELVDSLLNFLINFITIIDFSINICQNWMLQKEIHILLISMLTKVDNSENLAKVIWILSNLLSCARGSACFAQIVNDFDKANLKTITNDLSSHEDSHLLSLEIQNLLAEYYLD
eukprot:TRINITY_DN13884_c0_g1_i1.p1 TRINITY_DN13884_c0_g1~~TRINITY_DN13884_c0_g1_i1.p1  ORF type:complete len:706 (-),score=209.39 TRINITY_DN13884_c0_g1_i1:96-2213(-)